MKLHKLTRFFCTFTLVIPLLAQAAPAHTSAPKSVHNSAHKSVHNSVPKSVPKPTHNSAHKPAAPLPASGKPLPTTPPEIASGSVLVMDLTSKQILFSSHADKVRPMASLTKLMTAMVVLDARQPLAEMLTVDISHVAALRGVHSRLRINSQLSRREMLLLALMSSENRAAASLANHYPGGYNAFIRAMNQKAKALGMTHTHYAEPVGLSEENVSTARDLAKLVIASQRYPLISQFSTTSEATVTFSQPRYSLPFRNTNHLLFRDNWQIQLSKTGFTNSAGHCLAMRTTINQRPTVLVVMDAFGKYTHFADASRLRQWLETGKSSPVPVIALSYKQQKQATGG